MTCPACTAEDPCAACAALNARLLAEYHAAVDQLLAAGCSGRPHVPCIAEAGVVCGRCGDLLLAG